MNGGQAILVVNAGSSSIKADLFTHTDEPSLISGIAIKGIGLKRSSIETYTAGSQSAVREVEDLNLESAIEMLFEFVIGVSGNGQQFSLGHRIVHGGVRFVEPTVVDDSVIAELEHLVDIDPHHLPLAIRIIREFNNRFPGLTQSICMDTSLFANLPEVVSRLPIPKKYSESIRHFGFHGLSYEYLLSEFGRICGEDAAQGRIVMAHLGSGVSLSAFKNRAVVDTTMSFSPSSGVMMSSRSGDLDPSIVTYLQRHYSLDSDDLDRLISKESGLIGVSGISADMYDLLNTEEYNSDAKLAVDMFCYQIKKVIGSYASALGGIDSIIFSGGMGENAPKIRERIIDGLEFLGATLDDDRNNRGEQLISSNQSSVGIHVLKTDENCMIARHVYALQNNLTL